MPRATLEGLPPATRWRVVPGRSVATGPGGALLVEAGAYRKATPASDIAENTFCAGDVIELPEAEGQRMADLGFVEPPDIRTPSGRPMDGSTDSMTGQAWGGVSVTEAGADALGMVRTVTQ